MEREKGFGRAAAGIAVPAALQSMLQASFGAVDQLMIGQLGSVSVAGVGLAGRLGSAVSVMVAAGIAGIFALVCGLWPVPVMRLYTNDAGTIAEAAAYLRVLALSFLPSAGMAMAAALLRCMELASLPLLASVAAALLNTGLNWLLIFGCLGAPALSAL